MHARCCVRRVWHGPSSVRDAATIWAFRRECGILVHCLTGLQEPGDGIAIALDDLHSFMASGKRRDQAGVGRPEADGEDPRRQRRVS